MSVLLNPSAIIVPENRQRIRPTDIDSLAASIKSTGQIQPIVVRQTDSGPTLMVGGRRLEACRQLNIDVKADFWEDLDPIRARIVELEENVKREDLHWRDHVSAIANIHELYKQQNPDQSTTETAATLSITRQSMYRAMTVFKNLDNGLLRDATGIKQAYSILQIAAERRAASITSEIIKIGSQIFVGDRDVAPAGQLATEIAEQSFPSQLVVHEYGLTVDEIFPDKDDSGITPSSISTEPKPFILNIDFKKWLNSYTGPKFNLIHLDFPYDVRYDSYAFSTTSGGDEDYNPTGFFDLLKFFCANIDLITSYSAHVVCWFSMKFYEDTKNALKGADLFVHDHPLVWHKTDNSGIIPGVGNLYPRRIYETAFLCSRGRRPLVKSLANAYGAPLPSGYDAIHPSQKSEPMLIHFFSMLVDETTDFFDPTCGSGSALRAADRCGARSILGLESDEKMATAAESKTQIAHHLRKAMK
jgi:ParB/RepB/Spo0J family partition protein